MRQTVAKHLRKAALQEMIGDGVPKRDLVMGRHSVVNSPQSVRAMYLKLKQAWLRLWSGDHKPLVERQRQASGFHRRTDLSAGPAMILSPLKQLRALFPPIHTLGGGHEPHWIVREAEWLASRGDGAGLQRLARCHL